MGGTCQACITSKPKWLLWPGGNEKEIYVYLYEFAFRSATCPNWGAIAWCIGQSDCLGHKRGKGPFLLVYSRHPIMLLFIASTHAQMFPCHMHICLLMSTFGVVERHQTVVYHANWLVDATFRGQIIPLRPHLDEGVEELPFVTIIIIFLTVLISIITTITVIIILTVFIISTVTSPGAKVLPRLGNFFLFLDH